MSFNVFNFGLYAIFFVACALVPFLIPAAALYCTVAFVAGRKARADARGLGVRVVFNADGTHRLVQR